MNSLTTEQSGKINKVALAEKYGVTGAYVGQILVGKKKAKSKTSKKILEEAHKIIEILEGQPLAETTQTQTS